MDEEALEPGEPRRISGPLMLGLFLLPIVFFWFLLRPGYSSTSRIGVGLYMLFGVALWVFRGQQGY